MRLALLVPVLVSLGTRPSDALTVSNVVASTPVNTQIDVDLTKAINSEDPFPELGVGTPAHGTAALGSGLDIIYTPAAGFIGTDSFTFTVFCSCTPFTLTGTVTVAVGTPPGLAGVIGAMQQITLLSAYAQIDNFNRHLEELRNLLRNQKALGVSVNGQTSPGSSFHIASLASMLAPSRNKFASDAPRAEFGPQTAQANASDAVPIELPDRIGIFLNGNLSLRQITGTNGLPNASPRTTALSGGLDYRLNATTIVGVGAGYSGNTTDIGGGSKASSTAFNITAYGTTRPLDPVYVDAQLSYGHYNFRTTRDAQDQGFYFSSPNANAFWGSVTGGYEFESGPYTFGPYARGEGVHAVINAFTETGSAGFAATANSQDVNSAKAVLGFRGDRAISTAYGILSPHIRGEYLHEFIGTSGVSAAFASVAGSSFQINGYPAARNYFSLGGGVSFLTVNALSLFVDYDALVGYAHQTSHTITGGASIRF